MKIDAKTFLEFVDKVTIGGQIPEFVLVGTPSGIVCRVKTKENIGAAVGVLHQGAIKQLDDKLQLGFGNAKLFIDTLKKFTGDVEITPLSNMTAVTLKGSGPTGSRTAFRPLVTPDFVDTYLKEEPEQFNKFDGGVNVQRSYFDEIIDSKKVNSSETITIVFKDKKLFISSGQDGTNKIEDEIVGVDYKDGCGTYGELLDKIIKVAGDKINVSMYNPNPVNGPILVRESTEKMAIKWIVAPRTPAETK